MKFMEKVWGSLGLLEPVEAEEEQRHKNEEYDVLRSKKSSNIVNLPTPSQKQQIKVMIVEPSMFDEAQNVADYLKNRQPVVVNLENTDKEASKRIIDFISGTTYALGGSIQKVGNHIFLCAPNNVDVAYGQHEDSSDKTLLSWSTNK